VPGDRAGGETAQAGGTGVSGAGLDGREHRPETVWQAQEMYCVARLTYRQIHEGTGIAASTLKRWGRQYDWAAKRARIAQAEADIRADTIMARSEMLKELLESRSPLVGFAVAKLESLALDQAKAAREGRLAEAQAQIQRRRISTPADAAVALQEAIEIKLGRLLADPSDVDLKAIKDIKAALAMLDELRPKGAGKTSRKGLSAADVELIRDKILGG